MAKLTVPVTVDALELAKGHAQEFYEKGYQQGGTDKYKEITSKYMLLTEQQVDEIRADSIEEFAHELKESLNQEFPRNYQSTQPFFTLENVRLLIDAKAEEMKKNNC